MATLDLTQYGITGSTVIAHNPSYEQLFEEETKAGLEGFEVGQVTELGAVNVMTGIFTGRSPKDKYIVDDAQSHDNVWWTSEDLYRAKHGQQQCQHRRHGRSCSNKSLYTQSSPQLYYRHYGSTIAN